MTNQIIQKINDQLISITTLEKLAVRLAFELSESVDETVVNQVLELFTLVQTIQAQTEAVQESIETVA